MNRQEVLIVVEETPIKHPWASKSMGVTFGLTFAFLSLGTSVTYVLFSAGELIIAELLAAYIALNLFLYFSQFFTPHVLGEDALKVRMGYLFRVDVPYRNIARISNQLRQRHKVQFSPGGLGEIGGKKTVWAYTSRMNMVRLELCEMHRVWMFYWVPIPLRFDNLVINVEDIDEFARQYKRHAPAEHVVSEE